MIQLRCSDGRWGLLIVLSAIALFLLASCAAIQEQPAYHRLVMKGSIVQTSAAGVYLCIGKKDGASVGQELAFYKITYTGHRTPRFKKEK